MKVGLISVRPDQAGKPTREPSIYVRKDRIACGGCVLRAEAIRGRSVPS